MGLSVSPSRTYVAMCNKPNFDGYYFRKFVLPESEGRREFDQEHDKYVTVRRPYRNDSDTASWYFLNRLNSIACIDGCFAVEDLGPAGEHVENEMTREEKLADAQAKWAEVEV